MPPGPVTMSLRKRQPRGSQPFDFGVDVVDDEVDAVPAARLGFAAVGHRPSGRARRPAQQQTQVAAGDVGERRGGAGAQLEAEVGGVEVDGALDVVDHVADVDELVRHALTSWVCAIASSKKPMRVSRSAAVRSNAGRLRILRRRVADAPVHRLRRAGELGADLAHAVAEADDVVEAVLANSLRCLERRLAMSIPRSRITRTASDAAAWGGCRRWPRIAPSDRCSASASAIWERALLPVQRNSTRARGVVRPGRWCAGRQARVQRGAGADQQLAAAHQVEDGSRCPGRRPSCGALRPAHRRAAGAGGTRRGSVARRRARVSSPTRRSLCASSLSSRHRSGWPARRRNRGGGAVRIPSGEYIKRT